MNENQNDLHPTSVVALLLEVSAKLDNLFHPVVTLVELSLVKGEVACVKGEDSFTGRIPLEIQAT